MPYPALTRSKEPPADAFDLGTSALYQELADEARAELASVQLGLIANLCRI